MGAARLIAGGDIDDTQKSQEKALFEDRKPYSFSVELDVAAFPGVVPPNERLGAAKLSFVERRIDEGASVKDEPLPDTLMLLFDSIDIHGRRSETTLLLERPIGSDDISGLYN